MDKIELRFDAVAQVVHALINGQMTGVQWAAVSPHVDYLLHELQKELPNEENKVAVDDSGSGSQDSDSVPAGS